MSEGKNPLDGFSRHVAQWSELGDRKRALGAWGGVGSKSVCRSSLRRGPKAMPEQGNELADANRAHGEGAATG